MHCLSERGRSNITDIMSRVPKRLLTDSEMNWNGSPHIDLSAAENWLIRNEVLEICQFSINQKFQAHVSFCGLEQTQDVVDLSSTSTGQRVSGGTQSF